MINPHQEMNESLQAAQKAFEDRDLLSIQAARNRFKAMFELTQLNSIVKEEADQIFDELSKLLVEESR